MDDEDNMLEELAKLGRDLKFTDIRHLTFDQRMKHADLLMINVKDLPTAKKAEIAETSDDIEADLKSKADAQKRCEKEERWNNQGERQIKKLEDEGSDPDDEAE